jgi:SAM-dependent methyltransferase
MRVDEAAALIRDAVVGVGPVWADLGAGGGVFTRALIELLGNGARVYAVDRDPGAVADLARWAREGTPVVSAVEADFTHTFELPELAGEKLDGLLLANALHFVKDAGAVLARLAESLRPGGRVALVEYDRRDASRWVPYPIGIAHLPALAAAAGLSKPIVVDSRPSEYGGIIYAAKMDRLTA